MWSAIESLVLDRERIDFLEENELGVYPVVQTVRKPTTMNYPRYMEEVEFLGWSASSVSEEHDSVRSAIDSVVKR